MAARALLVLALCAIADALAQPRIDLTAASAWNGWTRPGRATEVDVRLGANVATRARLEVVAGRQVVRADVDLEPGRIERLQVPIASAEEVVVTAAAPGAPSRRLDMRIAQSEAPLLGVGLASEEQLRLEGFHTVTLAADDLPRNASAYASADALVLDGPTLRALDRRQLGALLAHAAQCGRIVLVNADPGARHVLDGMDACGERAVMAAASVEEAMQALKSSLATSVVPEISAVGVRELAEPGRVAWTRVLVLVAAYFALAAFALVLVRSGPIVVLLPAFATVAMLVLLPVIQPPAQLIVWSEAESGVSIARYHAWQLFPGFGRGHARVPVLPQFASARPCEPSELMRFDFDARRDRLAFAEFDTRLFRQVALCYSGMLPLDRAIAVEARPDASLEMRNTGRTAWPSGTLVANGLVHDLPPLRPGGSAVVRSEAGRPLRDAPTRIAMARTAADRAAALWELRPGDVNEIGMEWKGWLLLTAARP